MNVSRTKLIFVAAAMLNGCSAAGSQVAPLSGAIPAAPDNAHHSVVHPAICTPTLWALHSNGVYGYTAPNSPACVTLNGTYAGLPLQSPLGVAIGSSPNYLYVADTYNKRIVVFDASGNYVKWLDTTVAGTPYEPWGVCVSSTGILGVATIQEQGNGNVEFFPPTALTGSHPTGSAAGVRDEWCAFDSAGNFFVDGGPAMPGQLIAYLPSAYVNMPAQTLVGSGIAGSAWVGMYSRINSPADQTLSVATEVNHSTTQRVYTWNIAGPSTGPLSFTPASGSPYAFTTYPNHPRWDPLDGLAPSAGGASGTLFFADDGKGRVLQAPANGGSVTTYKSLSNTIGVATNPTGQY